MIARAALQLLGAEGPRGMTHRRIDRRLGLPEGSTSAYFRRREDLVRAAMEIMVEYNIADFNHFYKPVLERIERGAKVSYSLVAQCQYRCWQHYVRPENRFRTVAEFELFLESMRNDKFASAAAEGLERLHNSYSIVIAALGAEDVDGATEELARAWRGDLISSIFVRSPHNPPINVTYYESLFHEAIERTNAAKRRSDEKGKVIPHSKLRNAG